MPNLSGLTSREDLIGARRSIIDNIASTDGYVACLYSALAVLKTSFVASGRTVDPTVDNAVVQTADRLTQIKVDFVTAFNTAAENYNRYRSSGDTVGLLDTALLRPPSPESRVALPPGAGLLSIPARMLDPPPDCDGYFPRWVRIHHRGGTATVGYDVAPDGSVVNAQILQSSDNADIDDAARACVTNGWHFTPAIRAGVPTLTTGYTARISFFTSHRVGL